MKGKRDMTSKIRKLTAWLITAAFTVMLSFQYAGNTYHADEMIPADMMTDTSVYPVGGLYMPEKPRELTDEEYRQIITDLRKAGITSDNYEECEISLDSDYSSYYGSKYLYYQLNSIEQQLWDDLTAACEKFYKSDADLPDVYFNEGISASGISSDRAYTILTAFWHSNPKYFFLNGSASFYGSTLFPGISPELRKGSERAKIRNAIENVTAAWLKEINAVNGEVEKEKYICKKIADNVSYDYTNYDNNTLTYRDYSIIGALIDKTCVCQGYSMTMQYFCNAAGIDCVLVLGNNHAWNLVRLNGVWYEADVTWYDGESCYNTKWLNKSYATFLKNDKNNHTYVDYVTNTWNFPDCTSDLEKEAENVSFGDNDDKTFSIIIGKEFRLSPVVTPSDASADSLRWRSGNTNVAVVSADGTVTAVSKGMTFIQAITSNNTYAHYWVNVIDEIDNIQLAAYYGDKKYYSDSVSQYIYINGCYYMDISNPDNISYSAVYRSEDPSVADVRDGLIIGRASGNTKVTVTISTGKLKKELTVNVTVMSSSLPESYYDYDENNILDLSDVRKMAADHMNGKIAEKKQFDFNNDNVYNGADIILYRRYIATI